MRQGLAMLVEEMARCLTDGRLDDLAALHRFPCAFETGDRMEVFLRPEDLATAVGRWRERQWERGVRRVSARIVAQDLGSPDRCRVWVQWTHDLAGDATEDGGVDLLFVSRLPLGVLCVEMVDFLSLRLPEDAEREAPLSVRG